VITVLIITQGKNMKNKQKVVMINIDDITVKNAEIIEKTLDSFGIKARVAEVLDEGDEWHFSLEIVMGTRIDDILALDKDLSLALATLKPVRIIAPEPGRSFIGIIVSKPIEKVTKEKKAYKMVFVPEKVIEYVTYDNVERLRRLIARGLFLIAFGFTWIAEKIDSKVDVEFDEDNKKNVNAKEEVNTLN